VVPTRHAGSRIDAQRDVAVEKFGEDGCDWEDLGMIEEYMPMVGEPLTMTDVV
jgi:hypothetical protein